MAYKGFGMVQVKWEDSRGINWVLQGHPSIQQLSWSENK
jgi:hypothetical protein